MAIILGIARERADGERRLALTPETCRKLVAAGVQVRIERGAGAGIGVRDEGFAEAGAQLVDDARSALGEADVVLCVQPPPVDAIESMKPGAVLVGSLQPDADPARAEALRARGIVAFPLERLPRTMPAVRMRGAGRPGTAAVQITVSTPRRCSPSRRCCSARSSSVSWRA
jgi:NAD(P) transhydrogenase subunit alpha